MDKKELVSGGRTPYIEETKYKDPELGMTLVYLKTRKKAVELKHSE